MIKFSDQADFNIPYKKSTIILKNFNLVYIYKFIGRAHVKRALVSSKKLFLKCLAVAFYANRQFYYYTCAEFVLSASKKIIYKLNLGIYKDKYISYNFLIKIFYFIFILQIGQNFNK